MDYLEEKLSQAEVERVDAILKEEPEWIDVLENLEAGLKQDPNLRQRATDMTRAASEAAFEASSNTTTTQRAETPSESSSGKTNRMPIWKQPVWRMAAVIAILAIPATWILLQPQGSLYEQMSEQYLQPYAVTTMKSGPSAADILDQGLATYQTGDYAQAAHDLAAIVGSQDLSEDERLTARMYLGLSYLFSGDAEAANNELQAVVDQGNTTFLEPAQWYLAWSYWKTGEKAKAKAAFEDIARAPGIHRKPAQKILDKWQ